MPTLPSMQVRPYSTSSSQFRGVGDVIAAATKAVGIKPCSACEKRREALNRLMPFGNENPPSDSQLPAAMDGGEKKPADNTT